MVRRLLLWVAGAASAAIFALATIAFWPARTAPLVQNSDPVTSYDGARARAAVLIASTPPGVHEACRSTVLDHGRRTDDVFVLLHGLTNCPAQFRVFGEQLFASGSNVILPRTPYHGLADRLNDDQRLLTAQSMIDSANEAVDLARGYGDRVTVVGLSVNAVTAAWLAQERSDVDRAVLVAPFFAPYGIPGGLIAPLSRLLVRLPNLFLWWDPQKKTELAGSAVSYPRFATHPLAHVLRLGLDVFALAASGPPKARRILVVTSAADLAVNNARTARLVDIWRTSAPDRVATFEFPSNQKIPHDSIDPDQPGARIDIVYPVLRQQIEALLP